MSKASEEAVRRFNDTMRARHGSNYAFTGIIELPKGVKPAEGEERTMIVANFKKRPVEPAPSRFAGFMVVTRVRVSVRPADLQAAQ